jgi:hypothetical protein
MKIKSLALVLVFGLLASVSTQVCRAADVRLPPQRWEYAVLFYNAADLSQPYSWQTKDNHWSDLNGRAFTARLRGSEVETKDFFFWAALGEQGWELVGVQATKFGTEYVFKRPAA